MIEPITAIVTALLSSLTVLFSIWYKKYLDDRHKLKHTISSEDKSMFYLEMDKTCNVIRESLKADGSYLAYFHNGGIFSNGITMDKFTVVGEDYNERIQSQSYKKLYYATMINYIAYAYHRLLTTGRYKGCTGVPCGDNCLHITGGICDSGLDIVSDISFKNDLIKRRVGTIYMFIIKDPTTDKPIGFFTLEYMSKYILNKSDESDIWKHQNKLSRLLNMTVLTD